MAEIDYIENIVVDDSFDGRLDNFLQQKYPNKTRSKLKKLIDDGYVLVNNKTQKCGYKVKNNDNIQISFIKEEVLNATPEDIPIDIVYEDDDLCVINKAQGMVVHPAVGNYTGTLVNALCYRVKTLSSVNGDFRPGIVHRLDKDTSGLMLVAKNDTAHEILSKSIQEKSCKRFYKALLVGKLREPTGEIITNIARSLKDGKKMEVCDSSRGKVAISRYKVLEYYQGFSLVEFELKTGRTHQIRVHAKHLGHPVVGDETYGYGNEKYHLNGQLLHSYKIIFNQPTSKAELCFEIDLPDYFQNFIKKHCK